VIDDDDEDDDDDDDDNNNNNNEVQMQSKTFIMGNSITRTTNRPHNSCNIIYTKNMAWPIPVAARCKA
jgi:hypothetical protein